MSKHSSAWGTQRAARTYPSPIPVRRAWRGSAPLCAGRRSPAEWAAAAARPSRAPRHGRPRAAHCPPPPPAIPATKVGHLRAQGRSELHTIHTAGEGCPRVCDSSGVNSSSSSSSAAREVNNGGLICPGGNGKRLEVVCERCKSDVGWAVETIAALRLCVAINPPTKQLNLYNDWQL